MNEHSYTLEIAGISLDSVSLESAFVNAHAAKSMKLNLKAGMMLFVSSAEAFVFRQKLKEEFILSDLGLLSNRFWSIINQWPN